MELEAPVLTHWPWLHMKNTKEEVTYYANFSCNGMEYLALDIFFKENSNRKLP